MFKRLKGTIGKIDESKTSNPVSQVRLYSLVVTYFSLGEIVLYLI